VSFQEGDVGIEVRYSALTTEKTDAVTVKMIMD